MEERILVGIPYRAKGAQGKEIEYAIQGWRRHFRNRYLIVLIGENLPEGLAADDVMLLESPRVPDIPGMYRQHLDYVSCFRRLSDAFPDSTGFIFAADDNYAVNDFDIYDIMYLKAKSASLERFSPSSPNGWQRDKARTRKLLKQGGFPTRNFTTHVPCWFEFGKLFSIYEKYDMEHNSYVIEDLYFNIFYGDRVPLYLNLAADNVKCGIYRSNPDPQIIRDAFERKVWINNSEEGYYPPLFEMLDKHYRGERI